MSYKNTACHRQAVFRLEYEPNPVFLVRYITNITN